MLNVRIESKHDTTANWNNARGFVPLPGEIIIYDDYETKTWTEEEYGETVTKTANIPNIKIGTGNAYVQDLAFVDENTRKMLLEQYIDHIEVEFKGFDVKLIYTDEYEKVVAYARKA